MKTTNTTKTIYLWPILYGVFMAVAGYIVRRLYHVSYGEAAYIERIFPFLIAAAAGAVLCFLLQRKSLKPVWENDGKFLLYLLYILPIAGGILYFWITKGSISGSFVLLVFAALLIGIGEETVMRRILFIGLLREKSFGRALLISSALFGALHGLNLFSGMPLPQAMLQVGVTFLAGLFLALMYDYTKRFCLVVLAHFLWDYLLLCGAAKEIPAIGILVMGLMALQVVLTIFLLVRKFRKKPLNAGENV